MTSISAPSPVLAGSTVDVSVGVKNEGTQPGDLTVTLIDDDETASVGAPQSITLGAGASTTLTFSWTPTIVNIDHTLVASVALAGDENAANNSKSTDSTVTEATAGPDVTGILPNTMAAGSSGTVTIAGSGFATDAKVKFTNGGGPAPTASKVRVLDAETITATVKTKSGGGLLFARVWDVVVTNPDGSSDVLVGGFTVTP